MLNSIARELFPRRSAIALTFVLAVGFGLATFVLGLHVWSVLVGSLVAVGALLQYPEVALALYTFAGDVKGADWLSSYFPFDLTIALASIIVAGASLNWLRKRPIASLPRVYLLFLILVTEMIASLAYTPVFEAGLEKLLRFATITSVAILAPFFVLGTIKAFTRFLMAFAVLAFAICIWASLHLGGSDRLVTPSDNTIGLGHIACWLTLLIWFAPFRRDTLARRSLVFLGLGVPVLALIGSGSRGPAIACGVVIATSAALSWQRSFDLLLLAALGVAVVPFAGIPTAATDYLSTLVAGQGLSALLNFRGPLLSHAWGALMSHPLLGVGLQGFRYASPNPAVYNWPHNIFLEVACELGLPALAVVCAIFAGAFRESFRQLRVQSADGTERALAEISFALFLTGTINATNTGDINSDRATWMFASLVFALSRLARNRTASSAPTPALQLERALPR